MIDIEKMSKNTRLEVALEIIASKIASTSNKGVTVEGEEMQLLLQEREKMYNGDEKTIDKIIKQYGPEIKRMYEEA